MGEALDGWEDLRKKPRAIRLEGERLRGGHGQASRTSLDLCFNPLAHVIQKKRKKNLAVLDGSI